MVVEYVMGFVKASNQQFEREMEVDGFQSVLGRKKDRYDKVPEEREKQRECGDEEFPLVFSYWTGYRWQGLSF
jgi:hypothetical protein